MKDPKTEDFLTRGGWKWVYHKSLPFNQIDLKASLENPSRLVKNLDDERVLNYAISMEDGVDFNAIVLLNIDPAEKRPFKWEIATGCHRASAMEMAKTKEIDAYLVTEADNYRREVLIRQINTIEGVAPSIPDTMRQICLLHQKYHKPLAQLAREWHVKLANLQSYWNEELAIQRARKFGYDVNKHKIARRALNHLLPIYSDVVFDKALQFVVNNSISTTEIDILAKELKKVRDEKSGLDIIARYEKQQMDRRAKTQAKHGRVSPTGAIKLQKNCRTIVHQLEEGGIDKLHLSAAANPTMLKILVGETIEQLKKVHLELDRIERMSHSHSDQPVAGALH